MNDAHVHVGGPGVPITVQIAWTWSCCKESTAFAIGGHRSCTTHATLFFPRGGYPIMGRQQSDGGEAAMVVDIVHSMYLEQVFMWRRGWISCCNEIICNNGVCFPKTH